MVILKIKGTLINHEVHEHKQENIVTTEKMTRHVPKRCSWCTLSIKKEPLYMPYSYRNNGYYTTPIYAFDTFECMYAMIDTMDNNIRTCLEPLIVNMYEEACGTNDTPIKAPPKEIMDEYGGPFTQDEYEAIRNSKEWKFKIEYTITTPPEISLKPVRDTISRFIIK